MSSPMMIQYQSIKKDHPNDILFFRLGDFYEMFGDDALEAARVLEVVLTRRKNKADGEVPMCGVPFHSAEGYIAKLVRTGRSVAICEQVESSDTSTKLVRREVVRVVTPGTILLDGAVETSQANYVAAIAEHRQGASLALADISTGDFVAGTFELSEVRDLLDRYAVREIVLPEGSGDKWRSWYSKIKWVSESKWSFDGNRAWELLTEHFEVQTLAGFGFDRDDPAIGTAGAVITYLKYTQQADLEHIDRLRRFYSEATLTLDSATIQNLELFYPSHPSPRAKSLFEVMNKTVNPMGARMLRRALLEPLGDIKAIQQRQNDVSRLVNDSSQRESLREILGSLSDLERMTARVATSLAGPRDLGSIRDVLLRLEECIAFVPQYRQQSFQSCVTRLAPLKHQLVNTLSDTLPVISREGGFVRKGFRDDIDQLLALSKGGKDWLITHQEEERTKTGIPSLKVSYNKVFGYYIEVTKTHTSKVPQRYIKKQTMANADRYITEELKEFEEHILVAEQELLVKEQEIFEDLIRSILTEVSGLQQVSRELAYLDLIQSLASLATEQGYVCPQIEENAILEIVGGRHPVVEVVSEGAFVPNDTDFSQGSPHCILLTGPNMGGKSTYIRQVALITLLAHIGAYVPATSARVGLVDRIFTRVGASDNLSEGQSTFMVEMVEVANILHNATEKSLVILDEVGRGTSTYDGMSIARALTEHLATIVGCRTLFATHYHELLRLEQEVPGVTNYRITVNRTENGITFLHRVEAGGADESYGIDIARLAGFPSDVLARARMILDGFEETKKKQLGFMFASPSTPSPHRLDVPKPKPSAADILLQDLKEDLQDIDINTTTPIESLHILEKLVTKIKNNSNGA